MRIGVWIVALGALSALAEPLQWTDLPAATAALLRNAGLDERGFRIWQDGRAKHNEERLAAGSAEHIAYYLLQTRELGGGPPLQPAAEARKYLHSLAAPDAFLRGAAGNGVFSLAVKERMRLFWDLPTKSQRHTVLRAMAERLSWRRERILETAFRFLARQTAADNSDVLYQQRGLSADPYRPGMQGLGDGLAWLRSNGHGGWKAILLVGPGAELGSRFGVDDSMPVVSPQATALRAEVERAEMDCVDIRPDVTASLDKGTCHASTLDVVGEKLAANRYDLAVATNVLVYLDDVELGVALANLARALRPGGCLLHNDVRFAARLFGKAAGLPVAHYSSIRLGKRDGKEILDRIVLHCREK